MNVENHFLKESINKHNGFNIFEPRNNCDNNGSKGTNTSLSKENGQVSQICSWPWVMTRNGE